MVYIIWKKINKVLNLWNSLNFFTCLKYDHVVNKFMKYVGAVKSIANNHWLKNIVSGNIQ